MRWDVSVGLSLSAAELPTARAVLEEELSVRDVPEVRLAAGLVCYVAADFEASYEHLRTAFLTFQDQGNKRRAALAASHLGRVEHDGLGRLSIANGWYARAQRLVRHEEPCLEQGWVGLGRVGCSFVDADELEACARTALELAERFGEVDLECKALADLGMALVGHGRVTEGTTLIDEAMAMVSSGECANAIIASQVYCCIITACDRSSDLDRMESLIAMLQSALPGVYGQTAAPSLPLTHCEGEYGSLLCGSGRWRAGELALQRAMRGGDTMHYRTRARAFSALADLRVSQGRLPEASAALTGYEDAIESQLPLARLHLARGDHDLAAAVARRAVRSLAGDVMRIAPLQSCLVEAELARGEVAEATLAAAALTETAAAADRPHVRALARLATARALAAAGEVVEAQAELEAGLAELQPAVWPLVAADLHLELATLLQPLDRLAAISEARAALAILTNVGAARMHDAQALLRELGGSTGPVEPAVVSALTPRERQVLRLLAEGASNPDIARTLVISPKTAEHHVSNILRKLQLQGRSEAAVYAATLAAPERSA